MLKKIVGFGVCAIVVMGWRCYRMGSRGNEMGQQLEFKTEG